MKEEKINLFEISLRHKSMLHKEGLNEWKTLTKRDPSKREEGARGKKVKTSRQPSAHASNEVVMSGSGIT